MGGFGMAGQLAAGVWHRLYARAIYLRDPDRHGIEIYADRPRELWEGQVGERMTTGPIDVENLLGELDDPATEPFDGLPDGTTMGHVHLRVADVGSTIGFYRDVLSHCDSMHVVIEGNEFEQSIKRSVIANVLLVVHGRGRIFIENSLDRICAVRGLEHLHPLGLQVHAAEKPDRSLVVDYENFGHKGMHRTSVAAAIPKPSGIYSRAAGNSNEKLEPSPSVESTLPSTLAPSHTRKSLQLGGESELTVISYFSPLTTTAPASYYLDINESITYGTTTSLAGTAGIVDSVGDVVDETGGDGINHLRRLPLCPTLTTDLSL